MMRKIKEYDKVAGLTPYMCSYRGEDGRPYSSVLYANNRKELYQSHGHLSEFSIDGIAEEEWVSDCDDSCDL